MSEFKPQMIICGMPRPDGTYRIYASAEPNPAKIEIEYSSQAGYNYELGARMQNMLIIDAPDFGSCLRRLGEIWANQEAAKKEEAIRNANTQRTHVTGRRSGAHAGSSTSPR